MKKRRRVELHIEHREITVFARAGATTASAPVRPAAAMSGLMHARVCPTCGSMQLLPLAETVASPTIDLRQLQQGMDSGAVHMHRAQEGDWWICGESLRGA